MGFDGATYTDTPTKQADVFSLEGLRNWLRMQPPLGRYCYTDIGGCLLYQYLRAQEVPVREVGGWIYSDIEGKRHKFPGPAGPSNLLNQVSLNTPHTYGAALARCEAEIEAREKAT